VKKSDDAKNLRARNAGVKIDLPSPPQKQRALKSFGNSELAGRYLKLRAGVQWPFLAFFLPAAVFLGGLTIKAAGGAALPPLAWHQLTIAALVGQIALEVPVSNPRAQSPKPGRHELFAVPADTSGIPAEFVSVNGDSHRGLPAGNHRSILSQRKDRIPVSRRPISAS
jgi:hypothetical protein